jgi:hypothetical protein
MFQETVDETISMLSGHLTLDNVAITLCQNFVKQTSSDRAQYIRTHIRYKMSKSLRRRGGSSYVDTIAGGFLT